MADKTTVFMNACQGYDTPRYHLQGLSKKRSRITSLVPVG